MSIQNRETQKANEADFVNRVAPYDGNPLIQKTELLEIRDNKSDSVIFKDVTIKSINNPAAAFNVDFGLASGTYGDQINIDTTSSVVSGFAISFSNLDGNSIGKLSILKKTSQGFSFSNGQLLPDEEAGDQSGLVSLTYLVFKNGSTYLVLPTYNRDKTIRLESATPQLKTIQYEIGAWNMDSVVGITVPLPSGVTFDKIKVPPVVVIVDDAGTTYHPLNEFSQNVQTVQGAVVLWNSFGIGIERLIGGFFDSTNFNGGANRGWITVTYEV